MKRRERGIKDSIKLGPAPELLRRNPRITRAGWLVVACGAFSAVWKLICICNADGDGNGSLCSSFGTVRRSGRSVIIGS